jgi:hypothetical protein
MSNQSAPLRQRIERGLIAVAIFGAGALWGSGAIQFPPAARADVRTITPDKAFLAGGERSEIVLREIQDLYKREIIPTLKQMDTKTGRIEQRLAEIANRSRGRNDENNARRP